MSYQTRRQLADDVVAAVAFQVVAEAGRPRDRAARLCAAATVREVVVEARLVVEDAADRGAEVRPEAARVRVVRDLDELARRRRVEHVDVALLRLEVRVVVREPVLAEEQQAPAAVGDVPAQAAVLDAAGELGERVAVEPAAGCAAAAVGGARREHRDELGDLGDRRLVARQVAAREVVGEQLLAAAERADAQVVDAGALASAAVGPEPDPAGGDAAERRVGDGGDLLPVEAQPQRRALDLGGDPVAGADLDRLAGRDAAADQPVGAVLADVDAERRGRLGVGLRRRGQVDHDQVVRVARPQRPADRDVLDRRVERHAVVGPVGAARA